MILLKTTCGNFFGHAFDADDAIDFANNLILAAKTIQPVGQA